MHFNRHAGALARSELIIGPGPPATKLFYKAVGVSRDECVAERPVLRSRPQECLSINTPVLFVVSSDVKRPAPWAAQNAAATPQNAAEQWVVATQSRGQQDMAEVPPRPRAFPVSAFIWVDLAAHLRCAF